MPYHVPVSVFYVGKFKGVLAVEVFDPFTSVIQADDWLDIAVY